MEEAVLAVDATDRITLANRAALDLLGLTATPEGERLAAILPQPELARLVARTRQGEPDRDEFDLPGERPRRVLALTSMMRESGRTVIVLRDMTEIRHLERVRQDFVANVSHELRTPVSVLRATAETLLGGALDDPARSREFLGAIERNSERLSRLISDLLDISRIEAGTVHIERRELSLHEVARRTVAALERPAREKRMRVELAVGDDVRVRADSKALDQVIFNLLENAIKYTPADGTVTVGARAIDGRVRLEVADNGPGIAAEHRERVFERFYRIDPGRSRDMGGTGLGLAIVKHLVALMQGEVGVEPRAPQGTRFWVSLPSA